MNPKPLKYLTLLLMFIASSGFAYLNTAKAGSTTTYLIDPNRSYHQVIEESGAGSVIYTYGDDLISQTNAQGTHTFGYDGLGSTRILTDSTGTVQNAYGYQAFGELDYQYGTVENNYLFTGEQYDNNVGFYYLRARYYNQAIGRFTQMDTFPGMQFEPLSLHKYLYTHADPVNNIDPSGQTLIGRLMAGLRNAAIQARYAVTTISRKALNFVRKKKMHQVYAIQQVIPLANWHSYMYVEKIGTRKGRRYDVDILSDSKTFMPSPGIVKSRDARRSSLKGVRAKIVKFTFLQYAFWHNSVIGIHSEQCDISYSLSGLNCTTWTVGATLKAIAISKMPL